MLACECAWAQLTGSSQRSTTPQSHTFRKSNFFEISELGAEGKLLYRWMRVCEGAVLKGGKWTQSESLNCKDAKHTPAFLRLEAGRVLPPHAVAPSEVMSRTATSR